MLGAPPAAEGSAGEGEECLKLWVTLVVHSDPIMGGVHAEGETPIPCARQCTTTRHAASLSSRKHMR